MSTQNFEAPSEADRPDIMIDLFRLTPFIYIYIFVCRTEIA